MKIWTQCVWNIDGRLIEEESSWVEYDGPLSECKGGSRTTVTPSKPSPEETELTKRQIQLAEFQLTELRAQRELQAAERKRLEPFIAQLEELAPLQADFARQQLERAGRLGPIEEELLNLELERIRRGGAATEEEQALIDEAAARAIEQGESDISRFQTETTERIAQELAPALGLRPTDTPIQDRAARIAAEATRQQGQLVSGVRQAQATAGLNFPLARQQLESAQTQFQQQLSQATGQFQQQLQQAALLNRLRLSQAPQQLGLGLATGVSFALPNFQRGSTTTKSGGGFSLGGIGSILSGIGAIGTGFNLSSREFKEDPKGIGLSKPEELEKGEDGVYRPVGLGLSNRRRVDHEETLAKVEKLPVERWRYKEGLGLGDRDHLGPYAQDIKSIFGLGDDETIHTVDAIGIGLSATKGLAKRVERLEAQ